MPITINDCKCGRIPQLNVLTMKRFQILCEDCGVGVYGWDVNDVIGKWDALRPRTETVADLDINDIKGYPV